MNALIISLWNSLRTRPALARLSSAFPEFRWMISPGVRLTDNQVKYESIRGMECYCDWDLFRKGYPARALGCRLAGLQAINLGLHNATANGDEAFGVFQDDAVPVAGADEKLNALMKIHKGDWDCLWLDEGQISVAKEEDGRIRGARLCTGFILRTEYAADIVPRLEKADCEWDIWMEREMGTDRKFFSSDIVYQEAGKSEITGTMKWQDRAQKSAAS